MDKIQKVRKDMQWKVSNLITPATSHPILLLGSKQTKNSNYYGSWRLGRGKEKKEKTLKQWCKSGVFFQT